MLTTHTLLVLRSKIEYSYTPTLPKGLHGLWKGETYLHSITDFYYHEILKIYSLIGVKMIAPNINTSKNVERELCKISVHFTYELLS